MIKPCESTEITCEIIILHQDIDVSGFKALLFT